MEMPWYITSIDIRNYIALNFADFRRKKSYSSDPAARFCRQRSDEAVKSGGGRLLRYPPP